MKHGKQRKNWDSILYWLSWLPIDFMIIAVIWNMPERLWIPITLTLLILCPWYDGTHRGEHRK